MLDVGIASNLLQIAGSDLRGAVGALAAALIFGLIRDWAKHKKLHEKPLAQALLPWWLGVRVLGALGLVVWFVLLLYWGTNLVLNGSFEQSTKHWGSGYYEDLLRNGNWDTPERIANYKKAMRSFPYILHLDVPRKEQRTTKIPDSVGELRGGPVVKFGSRAFRIDHSSPEGPNQYGTLSQRISGLEPNHPYRATFHILAEKYTPGAVFLTTRLDWKPCTTVKIGNLRTWQPVTCEFDTDDRDQIDLRFVVQAPAVVWIDDIDLRSR